MMSGFIIIVIENKKWWGVVIVIVINLLWVFILTDPIAIFKGHFKGFKKNYLIFLLLKTKDYFKKSLQLWLSELFLSASFYCFCFKIVIFGQIRELNLSYMIAYDTHQVWRPKLSYIVLCITLFTLTFLSSLFLSFSLLRMIYRLDDNASSLSPSDDNSSSSPFRPLMQIWRSLLFTLIHC